LVIVVVEDEVLVVVAVLDDVVHGEAVLDVNMSDSYLLFLF
jgi:hypothetical protein